MLLNRTPKQFVRAQNHSQPIFTGLTVCKTASLLPYAPFQLGLVCLLYSLLPRCIGSNTIFQKMQARRALCRIATTPRSVANHSNFNTARLLQRPSIINYSPSVYPIHKVNPRNIRGFVSASSQNDFLNQHNSAVNDLSARVAEFHSQKQKFRISHGSTNSTRQTSKGPHVLDVSALNRVLKVDSERKIAYVEPNVPMDR